MMARLGGAYRGNQAAYGESGSAGLRLVAGAQKAAWDKRCLQELAGERPKRNARASR
jgi:hypothetical protein